MLWTSLFIQSIADTEDLKYQQITIISSYIKTHTKSNAPTMMPTVKVAEDDIAFKLGILKNHCIWTTIQASVVSFERQNYFLSLYWQKITFLSNFEQKKCILPDGQLWEWLTGGVALPQPKCNWSVGFAIARWPVGKASDNARIMLFNLFRYSLV